ncbi:unnamed protein product, partial [Meganyctiphanes norvegica]
MDAEKFLNVRVHPKVRYIKLLQWRSLVRIGLLNVVTRIHEHTHLTQQISSLHATILDVKRDLAQLESELEKKKQSSNNSDEYASARSSAFRKKTVSFSSTATSVSYQTAREFMSTDSDVASIKSDNDNASIKSDTDNISIRSSNDTDYFSPDEDDDEFFDLSPANSEGQINGKDESTTEDWGSLSQEDDELTLTEELGAIPSLLCRVDQLLDGTQEQQQNAYNTLKHMESENKQNPQFLWRFAKATRNMAAIASKQGNTVEQKTLIFKAYEHIEKALPLDGNSADIHKWYAILAGARGEYLGVKERVKTGTVFKHHIDLALQLQPQDATLHHLLGRFCYEVSHLSWIERRAAAALFGEVPASSYEEALEHFMAAENYKSTAWKENRLYVAKCYIQLANYKETYTWLQKASVAPIVTPDDEIVQKEIEENLQKYATIPEL